MATIYTGDPHECVSLMNNGPLGDDNKNITDYQAKEHQDIA